MLVRHYRPADRAEVRSICVRTGYMGDPISSQWRDSRSFADVFSRYYTDREPESLLVVEDHGAIMGYLFGCLDSRRPPHIARTLGPHLLARGLLFRAGTAGFMWRAGGDLATDLWRGRLPPAQRHDERWPAHLHINLLPQARGNGLGAQLIAQWLDTVEKYGLPGCHLETLAENTPAIAFFDAMGFTREATPLPAPGLRSPDGARHHIQLMVHHL